MNEVNCSYRARQLIALRQESKTAAMSDEQLARRTARGGLRKIFRKKNLFVDNSHLGHKLNE